MKRIGSYEVIGLLGEGGMGAVYLAKDTRFDRDVAIKLLHAQFQRDPGVVERFKSEAVIQAKLSHPHIVAVMDFISEPGTLAMVMEHVEGKPLDRVIEECGGPMAPERAVQLMSQVLGAMGYAHSKGLVHRDIKPSNIMVQQIGGQEFAKVMDFGIAKILGSEKLKTATGAKMGTLAYMSPEHVKSPKHVDARSDIYSLGVVLYEMLTGSVPFDADSEYELMRQIVERSPQALKIVAGSTPGLRDVVHRALEKDPARRFSTCDEMRVALGSQVATASRDPVAKWAPPPDVGRGTQPPVPRIALGGRSAHSRASEAVAGAVFEEWFVRRQAEFEKEKAAQMWGVFAIGCWVGPAFLVMTALNLGPVGLLLGGLGWLAVTRLFWAPAQERLVEARARFDADVRGRRQELGLE